MNNKSEIQLIFATSNQNKVKEVSQILAYDWLNIKSLKDIDFSKEIEETGLTLEENAVIKTKAINELYDSNVFAEDTGLEVYALDMAPGVYTARYAGAQKNADDNMNKLMSELKERENRGARFRTALSLFWDGEYHLFEGIVEGKISHHKKGQGGFGYDPVFVPDGFDKTFAELPSEVKNEISHRAKAVALLKAFLEKTQMNRGVLT